MLWLLTSTSFPTTGSFLCPARSTRLHGFRWGQSSKTLPRPRTQENIPASWFSNAWVQRDVASTTSPSSVLDSVLYISPTPRVPLLEELAKITSELAYAELTNCRQWATVHVTNFDPSALIFVDADITVTKTKSIIIDVTSFTDGPLSGTFSMCWKPILQLMKVLMTGKIHYDNLIILSSSCIGNGNSFSVGAVVQGMFRVFRRETSSHDSIWGLDIPQGLSSTEIINVIGRELEQRPSRVIKDSIISVRYDAVKGSSVNSCQAYII